MNIDRIIKESIDRFILREIDEGIDDMNRTFSARVIDPQNGQYVTVKGKNNADLRRKVAALQGKTVQKRQYTKRRKLNSLSDVCAEYPNSSPVIITATYLV